MNSNPNIEIKTERLLLRPLRMTDADDLLEYQSNAEIVRYIPWPERSYEQVVEALQRAIDGAKSELVDEGDYLILGWEFEGKIIGQSNMGLQSKRDKCADIGWVTHQDYQRQGFAYEATVALMRYGFEKFGLHRMIANIDTRAKGSALLAEKLGMRREAEFKQAEFFKGDWCDMWLYAILETEFGSE